MIAVQCSGCGKTLKVKEALAGKKVKCPQCGHGVMIPSASPAGMAEKRSPRPATEMEDKTLPTSAEPAAGVDGPTLLPDGSPRGGSEVRPSTISGETVGSNAPGQAQASQQKMASAAGELTEFLAPPQGPGEIGRLGAYRVLKVLGAGGMGVVYQAEDPQLKRAVALKAMLPSLGASESARKRFLREAQAAAAINHDNIVHIYQVGEDRGIPFMAMQFLQGEPLDARIKRQGKLPLADILRIGRETAKGLAAAHKQGLIHRDIKPANLWLEGEDGRVKILDFGLARSTGDDTQLTQHGAIIGTPAYMAPEQATGKTVDQRCDLFSLGCVLYRLCTGQLPFQGKDTISTLAALALENPKPPSVLNPRLPVELSDLIMQLLAKAAKDRPASAQAVVEAIQNLEEDRTVEQPVVRKAAGRKGPPAKSAASTRSHWPLVAGVAAALLLVVGGIFLLLRLSSAGAGDDNGTKPIPEQTENRSQKPAQDPNAKQPEHPGHKPAPDPNAKQTEHPGQKPAPLVPTATPLSPRDLVLQPAFIPGVKSWTIEPPGHRGPVRVSAFAADNKRLASAGGDGTVRIWDRASGRLQRILFGHAGPVLALAWSPGGKMLASGSADRAVQLWDADSGQTLRTMRGHATPVHSLAWSPDGKFLASGSADGTVRLWEAGSGQAYHAAIKNDRQAIALGWRPDGKTLVASTGNTHCLIDVASGTIQARHVTKGPWAWSPGYKLLAHRVGNFALQFWDADSGKLTPRFVLKDQKKQKLIINALAWSANGKTLATGAGKRVIFWDAESGKVLNMTKDGHSRLCNRVAFSPDGKLLVSCGEYDHGVQVWKVRTGENLCFLKGLWNSWGAAFSPDSTMVSAFNDHPPTARPTVAIWQVASGKMWYTPVFRGDCQDVTWSPDSKSLAAMTIYGDDAQVRVWQADAGRLRHVLPLSRTERTPWHPSAWSPDGQILATSAANFAVQLWDIKSLTPLRTLTGKPAGWVHALAWSPDSKTVASFAGAGWLWDAETAKALRPLTGKPIGYAVSLAWSPDGKTLAAANRDWNGVDLWDIPSGMHRLRLEGHTDRVEVVAWSPDGKILASGSKDKSVRLWKASGEFLTALKAANSQGRITAMTWLPDGKTLATLSFNSMLCLWDTTNDKFLRAMRLGTRFGRFSRDGLLLASINDNGGVRLWETQTGQPRGSLFFMRRDIPNHAVAVSADGHYRGEPSRLIDRELVYVVWTDQGQEVLSTEEFAQKYQRRNDPDQVRLLGK